MFKLVRMPISLGELKVGQKGIIVGNSAVKGMLIERTETGFSSIPEGGQFYAQHPELLASIQIERLNPGDMLFVQ